MLGTILMYMNRKVMKIKGMVLLLISTLPIAMFANIARVTGTGILAHFHGASVARGFLHEFSGMVVFVFGFALLLCTYVLIQYFQKGS
jgi:exosortase/archaeosortase family protein